MKKKLQVILQRFTHSKVFQHTTHSVFNAVKKKSVSIGQVIFPTFYLVQRVQAHFKQLSYQSNNSLPTPAEYITTKPRSLLEKSKTLIYNTWKFLPMVMSFQRQVSKQQALDRKAQILQSGISTIEDLHPMLLSKDVRALFTTQQKDFLSNLIQEDLYYRHGLPKACFQDRSGRASEPFSTITTGTLYVELMGKEIKDKQGNPLVIVPACEFETDTFLSYLDTALTPDNVVIKREVTELQGSAFDLMSILDDFDTKSAGLYFKKMVKKVEKYSAQKFQKIGSVFVDTRMISYDKEKMTLLRQFIKTLNNEYQENIYLSCDMIGNESLLCSPELLHIVEKEHFANNVIAALMNEKTLHNVQWHNLSRNDVTQITAVIQQWAEQGEISENWFTEFTKISFSHLSKNDTDLYEFFCDYIETESPFIYAKKFKSIGSIKDSVTPVQSMKAEQSPLFLPVQLDDISSKRAIKKNSEENLKKNPEEKSESGPALSQTSDDHATIPFANTSSTENVREEMEHQDQRWEAFSNRGKKKTDGDIHHEKLREDLHSSVEEEEDAFRNAMNGRAVDLDLRKRLHDLKQRNSEDTVDQTEDHDSSAGI